MPGIITKAQTLFMPLEIICSNTAWSHIAWSYVKFHSLRYKTFEIEDLSTFLRCDLAVLSLIWIEHHSSTHEMCVSD